MSDLSKELRQLYPAAFNDRRPPLAVGIHEALRVARDSEVLREWTSHPLYLRNIIAGQRRVGLTGEPGDAPSREQRLMARDTLARQRPGMPLRTVIQS